MSGRKGALSRRRFAGAEAQVEGRERTALSESVRTIAASGLRYQPTAAGASVEGDLDTILAALRAIDTHLHADGIDHAVLELRLQLEPEADGEQLTLPESRHNENELLLAQEHKGYGYDEGERLAAMHS